MDTNITALHACAYSRANRCAAADTGNSSIAAWSANSTKCANCAAKWNAYNASCNIPANK
jgi:hypothetical protein